MKILFQQQVNYLSEAAGAVMRSRTPNERRAPAMMLDIMAVFQSIQKKANLKPAEKTAFLDQLGHPIHEVATHAKKAMKGMPKERLEFYFAPVFSGAVSLGMVLCEYITLREEYTAATSIDRERLALCLLNYVAPMEGVAFGEPLEALLPAVDRALTGDAEKWKFVQMIQNLEEYAAEVQALLAPVTDALREKAEILEGLYARCVGDMRRHMEVDPSFLKTHFRITLTAEKQLVFAPRVMRFGEMTLYDAYNAQRLEFGVACESLFAFTGRMDQYALSEALRALGDKRRMEIMQLLRKRPHYGHELAAELKLSPTTISHHMDILLTNRLIALEHDGVKIQYSVAESAVEQLIERIRQELG